MANRRERFVLQGHHGTVWSVAFSPDGKRAVTADDDHTALIWNVTTGALERALKGHTDRVWYAAFSPDGARIVTASGDNTARLWDAATGNQLAVLAGHRDAVTFAAFSPDDALILTASDDAPRGCGMPGPARPLPFSPAMREWLRLRPSRPTANGW